MPHVKPLTIDDAPKASQPILKAIEKKFGQSLNLFNSLAYQPDVLGGVTQINDGLQNDLPAKLRELAYYKASQINGCDYCSYYHRQAAIKAGLSESQLDSIDPANSDLFDDQEQAVLRYTDQLTRTANVDQDIVDELKTFLDERQLVTLASAVALANFTNRVNHGLAVELP